MTYDDDYRCPVLLDFGGGFIDDAPATFEVTGTADRESIRATLSNLRLGGLCLSREQVETAVGPEELASIEEAACSRWMEANGPYLRERSGWGDAA